MARKKYTMLDVLEDWAKIQPNEKCLLQDDKIITYQERFQLSFFRLRNFFRVGSPDSKLTVFWEKVPKYQSEG